MKMTPRDKSRICKMYRKLYSHTPDHNVVVKLLAGTYYNMMHGQLSRPMCRLMITSLVHSKNLIGKEVI